MRASNLLSRLLLSGLLLPLIGLFVLLTWLFFTSAGANWALSFVPGLQVRSLHGSIAHGLSLRGLTYAHGHTKISAQQVSWAFHPSTLLWGELRFSSVLLQDAKIWTPKSTPSQTAPTLTIPQLPSWMDLFSLRVSPVQVESLSVYQNGKREFLLQHGQCASLGWNRGTLEVHQLVASGSFGKISANAAGTLANRKIVLTAHWQGAQSTAPSLALTLDWHGISANSYGGPIQLALRQGKNTGQLQAIATIKPNQIALSQAQITSSKLPKPVHGDLRFSLPKVLHGDYGTEGHLFSTTWPGMPKMLGNKGLSVQWSAAGRAGQYHGNLHVNAQSSDLTADFQSSQDRLVLRLTGHLLQGKLLPSQIETTLSKNPSVKGHLDFQQIPVQAFFSKIPGTLSANLQIAASSSANGWRGNAQWLILPSQIYQQKLQGDGELQFAGKNWQLKHAILRGPGLQITAQGSVKQRLMIDAKIQRWAGILPGASGDTQLSGWIGQRDQAWQGALHLQGRNLRYQRTALAHLALDGSLNGKSQIQGKILATGLVTNGQSMDIRGGLSGSLQQAALTLSARDNARELRLAGTVWHQPQDWKLDLQKLQFRSPNLGLWNLTQTATLQWQKGRANISLLHVAGANGASIQISGGYGPQSTQGSLDVIAHSLPLDFWNRGLDAGIRGRWNARIHGQCNGVCQLKADWGVTDTALHWHAGDANEQVAVQQFNGNLIWGKSGLQLHSQLQLAKQQGNLQLSASSPATLQLPWRMPKAQPLQAQLIGHVPGVLLSHLPTGSIAVDPSGDIQADLHASGTWGKPLWQGRARAQGLGCYIPEAGLHLTDISANLTAGGDKLILDSLQVHSGTGNLQGHGDVSLSPGAPFQIHITGKDFLALNLPQVQASVAPDIDIRQQKKEIHISGKVETTRLRILGTDFGGPKPSSDVAFVRDIKQKPAPSHLAVDLQVGLGKNSKVLIGGLHADLQGNLRVRMIPPSTTPLIEGALHMVDGKYEIYGNSLTFEKGTILFSGPPKAASLDVLAVRKIKNSNSFAVDNETILAGVQVTGNLSHPVVNLYSKPSMAQNDILSYLILGTPSTGLQSQEALLSAAAGQLFSAGRAAVFGNSISSAGIDVGVSSSNNSSGLAADMVTLGHYITPNLYFSVGQSILGQGTVARLRYRISRHIEIQTESGTQDGANIFYRIDF
ncbi:translocation/assembly module TamB domain-containing protein [Acidithiobacillus acidisediminis]|uniref:translocation/assembly module TamB domain-containing protein n=1 Tax=Acidithiobacillus acidisediminis TaxID=2937799 RepID=UPI002010B2B7|nr:translocation/assembly module TamB domain-containing protein [Acidithiobacillus sp. S30A2]